MSESDDLDIDALQSLGEHEPLTITEKVFCAGAVVLGAVCFVGMMGVVGIAAGWW